MRVTENQVMVSDLLLNIGQALDDDDWKGSLWMIGLGEPVNAFGRQQPAIGVPVYLSRYERWPAENTLSGAPPALAGIICDMLSGHYDSMLAEQPLPFWAVLMIDGGRFICVPGETGKFEYITGSRTETTFHDHPPRDDDADYDATVRLHQLAITIRHKVECGDDHG